MVLATVPCRTSPPSRTPISKALFLSFNFSLSQCMLLTDSRFLRGSRLKAPILQHRPELVTYTVLSLAIAGKGTESTQPVCREQNLQWLGLALILETQPKF